MQGCFLRDFETADQKQSRIGRIDLASLSFCRVAAGGMKKGGGELGLPMQICD